MRWWVAAGLQGCVPCTGEVVPVEAGGPLAPGESRALVFRYRDEVAAGPDDCGGYWEVDGVEGGDAAVGTITDCGVYVAPAVPPDADPVVLAALDAPGTCADCCPHGTYVVPLDRR